MQNVVGVLEPDEAFAARGAQGAKVLRGERRTEHGVVATEEKDDGHRDLRHLAAEIVRVDVVLQIYAGKFHAADEETPSASE